MHRPAIFAACLLAAAAPAYARNRHHRLPPPPPRVWHYFEDAPSPFLQYSWLRIADPRRTTLSCEDTPGVIKVEQVLPHRRPGEPSIFVVGSGGESEAADAQESVDERQPSGGAAISATFPIDSPVIKAFTATGDLKLATHAQTFDLPAAPQELVRHFMAHCAP